MERTIIFDIETDGLALSEISTIHTLSLYDSKDETIHTYDLEEVGEGIEHLKQATLLVGHNIIDYDLPVINEFYGDVLADINTFDTLVASRVVWADIFPLDIALTKKGKLPRSLMGRYSLESFGYRLGIKKGDFGKDTDWKNWSEEMSKYCRQDVLVTKHLYDKILTKNISKEALDLEHDVMRIIKRQMDNGIRFDVEGAQELYVELLRKHEELEEELIEVFGSWIEPKDDPNDPFVPKRDNQRYGYIEGAPCVRIKYVTFNPSSRVHIYKRLKEKYDWEPDVYTDAGNPSVSEDVLKSLPFPEAELLIDYLTIDKRIGQLSDGKQAWLKQVKSDSRIYGYVNTNGTVTGRMTHSKPNMAQVPATRAPYGKECRSLFRPRKDWKLVGADASGLELRCLAHFMAKYDDGAYTKYLLEDDIHTVNQHSAGLEERSQAKRFIYAFLYGAGNQLLGEITAGATAEEGEKKAHGKRLRSKFLKQTKGLKQLQDTVQEVARERGFLFGLDGRPLTIRAIYSALNVLLQSAGAIIMKKALVICDGMLREAFNRDDWEYVLNVHDEFQIESKPEIADQIGEIMVKSIVLAGEYFNFRCPLDGEYQVGDSWADTH